MIMIQEKMLNKQSELEKNNSFGIYEEYKHLFYDENVPSRNEL